MKTEDNTIKGNFTLPNESVTVKFIGRRKGMAANVDANHVISGGMLNKAVKKFSAPLQRNKSIKNVLTEDEKAYLEKATGVNLSVYGDFWKEYMVSLYKDDNFLDLSNPMDYISYKILLHLKDDIAPTWAERNNKQTYQFAIARENDEIQESKTKHNSMKEAFKLYGKMEDDKETLLGVLKLLTNRPISKDSKLDWLQNEIGKIIDSTPYSFVSVVTDSKFYTKMLLNSAVDFGVVVRSGNKYTTIDGLDLCNPGELSTFDNAVIYLDNPKNQEVRNIIEAKIEKAKK